MRGVDERDRCQSGGLLDLFNLCSIYNYRQFISTLEIIIFHIHTQLSSCATWKVPENVECACSFVGRAGCGTRGCPRLLT